MADLSQTAASVVVVSGTPIDGGTSGAAITAGQPLYIDTADSNKLKPASNATQAASVVAGIALNDCPGADQRVSYLAIGTINIGATLTIGTIYVLSASGAISPAADLATNDWVTVIGIAITAANLQLGINSSQVQWP